MFSGTTSENVSKIQIPTPPFLLHSSVKDVFKGVKQD